MSGEMESWEAKTRDGQDADINDLLYSARVLGMKRLAIFAVDPLLPLEEREVQLTLSSGTRAVVPYLFELKALARDNYAERTEE